ncbi:hypothetical protein [Chromobacterium sphagni]|nr:hypothetical protein [Chromobacterium sphagni]OHX21800.1 hypothetical protein BI344_04650 [Chromobacterium sphagni]
MPLIHPELIPLIALLVLYAAALLYSLRQAWRLRRLHWLGCVLLLIAGFLSMLLARPVTPDSGEMPPGFGLGVMLALAGIAATTGGAIWRVFSCRRRRRR